MIKSQANNENFQARAASFSTHGSRTGANLLGWGEAEALTPSQQREALVRAKLAVDAQLKDLNEELRKTLPFKQVQEKAAQRAELRARAGELAEQLRILNEAKQQKFPDMGECIIDVLRSRMTKPQWQCVLAEAHERFRRANGHAYDGSDY